MAIAVTYDTTANTNPKLTSYEARGINMVVGTLAVTYSAATGLTWSIPLNTRLAVFIPPVSGYMFQYNTTTSMFTAWNISTTGPVEEVPSDTDFTDCTDAIRFVAFGY